MKKKNYKVKLKVKELLEERNITQKKLAQISGIRESTISDIVRGTRTVINFEHFCKVSVKCRARAEEKMKLARLEFKMPPLLTDAEIEEVLDVLPDLTKWANEITAYATEAAIHHGKEWNGFKVVEGRSNRKYRDELLVAEAAREHGYTDIYRQTLIPMTEMQKLMGKSAFEEILGDLIYNPPGKPILVPNTDKRPAMNVTNAENEFDKIMED